MALLSYKNFQEEKNIYIFRQLMIVTWLKQPS